MTYLEKRVEDELDGIRRKYKMQEGDIVKNVKTGKERKILNFGNCIPSGIKTVWVDNDTSMIEWDIADIEVVRRKK